MKKPFVFFIAMLLTMTSILAWCQTNVSQNNTETKTVRIWIVAPMSWPGANYWEDAVQVYQYFVDKFNASQNDLQVELVIEDWKCEWASATSAAQKLISVDGVKIMLWWICSSEAIPAWKLAQSNKVLSLVPWATMSEIWEIWDYVYRFWDEKTMMEQAARYLESENANNILILLENESSSVTMSNALQSSFNGESDVIKFHSSEQDFSVIAKQTKEKIERNNIDYLVFIAETNEVKINLFQALDKEWIIEQMNWKILWNELRNSADIIDAFGDKLNGFKIIQLASAWDMWSKAMVFVNEYLENHTISTDPYLTILEWEWILLLLDAIDKNWVDADSVKKYINDLSENNLRDWLFGQYYFGPTNQAIWMKYLIYEIQNWVSSPIF